MKYAKCNQWHLIATRIELVCEFQDFKTIPTVKDNSLLKVRTIRSRQFIALHQRVQQMHKGSVILDTTTQESGGSVRRSCQI